MGNLPIWHVPNVSVTATLAYVGSQASCFCHFFHSIPYVAGTNLMTLIQVVNPVKSLKISAKSKTLKVRKSYKLKATIKPKNATNKKVTYQSSNKKVATVSKSGKITAKKKGKATITVTSKSNPKVKAKCKITVK